VIHPILQFGAPELQLKSQPVERFDEELKTLTQDMLQTMYAAPGIGLAAPQIGINLRLTVIDITAGEEKGHQIVLVNPKITEQEGGEKGEEGCLSIPGFTAVVERPQQVRVVAQDLDGNPIEVGGSELLARAICHEIDHLNGILYIDRISRLKRELIKRKIQKLVRAGEW